MHCKDLNLHYASGKPLFKNPLIIIVFIPQNNDKAVEELQQEVSQLTTSLRSAQAENGSLNSEVCVYSVYIHAPVM